MKGILERRTKHNQFVMAFAGKEEKQLHSVSILRYQGTPNDNIAFSPFERQAFHKDPDKLYIF